MDLAKFLYAYESVCIIRQNSYVVGKRLDNLSYSDRSAHPSRGRVKMIPKFKIGLTV